MSNYGSNFLTFIITNWIVSYLNEIYMYCHLRISYICYLGYGGQNDNCSLKFFILISITPIYVYIYIFAHLFSKNFLGPFGPPLKSTKMLSWYHDHSKHENCIQVYKSYENNKGPWSSPGFVSHWQQETFADLQDENRAKFAK